MTDRVLVTGAGGFVGTNLVLALARDGAEVTGVVRPGGKTWRTRAWEGVATVRPADLRTPSKIDRLVHEVQPDVVFHLATARDEQRPEELLTVNVAATATLIASAAAAGVRRIVHTGSSTEYGDVPRPYDEDGPRNPTSWYGASRAVATDLVLAADHRGDVEACVLRLFHVHGPWESPERLVPRAVAAARNGSSLALTPRGLTHDLVHVDDVVARACFSQRPRHRSGDQRVHGHPHRQPRCRRRGGSRHRPHDRDPRGRVPPAGLGLSRLVRPGGTHDHAVGRRAPHPRPRTLA